MSKQQEKEQKSDVNSDFLDHTRPPSTTYDCSLLLCYRGSKCSQVDNSLFSHTHTQHKLRYAPHTSCMLGRSNARATGTLLSNVLSLLLSSALLLIHYLPKDNHSQTATLNITFIITGSNFLCILCSLLSMIYCEQKTLEEVVTTASESKVRVTPEQKTPEKGHLQTKSKLRVVKSLRTITVENIETQHKNHSQKHAELVLKNQVERRRSVQARVEIKKRALQSKAVRACKFFAGLDENALTKIIDAMGYSAVDAGVIICKQGEPANALFLILSGACNIIIDNKIVGTVQDADLIGERALFPNNMGDTIRTATVQSSKTTTLLELSKTSLDKLILSGALAKKTMYKLRAIAKSRVKQDKHRKRKQQGSGAAKAESNEKMFDDFRMLLGKNVFTSTEHYGKVMKKIDQKNQGTLSKKNFETILTGFTNKNESAMIKFADNHCQEYSKELMQECTQVSWLAVKMGSHQLMGTQEVEHEVLEKWLNLRSYWAPPSDDEEEEEENEEEKEKEKDNVAALSVNTAAEELLPVESVGGKWVERTDELGRTYYENLETSVVQWNKPDDSEKKRQNEIIEKKLNLLGSIAIARK